MLTENENQSSEKTNYKLPDPIVWEHVCKLSIVEDKPIMLDYWTESCDKKALIGVRSNNEKLLVKNAEEYTSPISKIFKVEDCFIICTENSIYLTSCDIPTRKIS